ncbi:uncharacterized protein MONBRDRAFT_31143 [Monosiga brevicollis MX1]|uniref:J domain-containing protein n=1 Tax=Monosiga brevicollis TaxID=81824 RepID=A9URZ8_MONBE|nr:uncharacterized protein MONBRDRAFT_31143 [Monosiga brevicollis MX1]EDQ92015.1 predicted protein [Monosiga brevicollis MX1]|eukprot:XP_001743301.1 hypothetical protein [Monosiga brevicollis MX1]
MAALLVRPVASHAPLGMLGRWLGPRTVSATRHVQLAAAQPRAVPFAITKEEAKQALKAWIPALASQSWVRQLQAAEPEVAYLPFYVFNVKAHSRFQGDVVQRRKRAVFDAEKQVYEPRDAEELRSINGWLDAGISTYDGSTHDMQVYAGFRFRRQYVQAVKGSYAATAEAFHSAKHLQPPAVLAAKSSEPETTNASYEATEAGTSPSIPTSATASLDSEIPVVLPFEMFPTFAWELARTRVEAAELAMAERCMLAQYDHALRVENIKINTVILDSNVTTVYLPAFIFHAQVGKNAVRVFVNGVTGEVGGEKVYSSAISGTAAGIVSGALAASIFPEPTTEQLAASRRQSELAPDAKENEYLILHHAHVEEQAVANDKHALKAFGHLHPDSEGHYGALGLSDRAGLATTNEIRNAFRRLLWAEGACINARVQDAYRVLRNYNTRLAYDQACAAAAKARATATDAAAATAGTNTPSSSQAETTPTP